MNNETLEAAADLAVVAEFSIEDCGTASSIFTSYKIGAAKLLAPLGKPATNAPKYFATVDVVAAAQDREWLSQATRALARHWRMKNSRKKSAQSSASFLDAAV